MSAPYDLLNDRLENTRGIERLLEALSPEAAAPLEVLTPLADAWRKYREADIAADGRIIEQGGAKYSPEVEDAINAREELEGLFAAMPSGSPAGALVRILWASLQIARALVDADGKVHLDRAESWAEAVLMEATLDLLKPGALKCIAAGLAGGEP